MSICSDRDPNNTHYKKGDKCCGELNFHTFNNHSKTFYSDDEYKNLANRNELSVCANWWSENATETDLVALKTLHGVRLEFKDPSIIHQDNGVILSCGTGVPHVLSLIDGNSKVDGIVCYDDEEEYKGLEFRTLDNCQKSLCFLDVHDPDFKLLRVPITNDTFYETDSGEIKSSNSITSNIISNKQVPTKTYTNSAVPNPYRTFPNAINTRPLLFPGSFGATGTTGTTGNTGHTGNTGTTNSSSNTTLIIIIVVVVLIVLILIGVGLYFLLRKKKPVPAVTTTTVTTGLPIVTQPVGPTIVPGTVVGQSAIPGTSVFTTTINSTPIVNPTPAPLIYNYPTGSYENLTIYKSGTIPAGI